MGHSLDHNDRTWTWEAWAQHGPWPDVKKIDDTTEQFVSFSATQSSTHTGATSLELSDDNRRPPARRLSPGRRRNDEKKAGFDRR